MVSLGQALAEDSRAEVRRERELKRRVREMLGK